MFSCLVIYSPAGKLLGITGPVPKRCLLNPLPGKAPGDIDALVPFLYGNTAQYVCGIFRKIRALILSLFLEVHKVHLRKGVFLIVSNVIAFPFAQVYVSVSALYAIFSRRLMSVRYFFVFLCS